LHQFLEVRMDSKLVISVLIAAFVLWSIYRRVRRNIGRQPVTPMRMRWRIAILLFAAAMFAFSSMRDIELIGALLAGIAGGCVLAWFGLRGTKFETTPEGKFYTPHTYIGIAISLLFIGRIAYRFLSVYPLAHAAADAGANPFAAYQKSPMTLAIFGIVVGYYVAYYIGVLVKSGATSPPPMPP
jgi:hypothetical protein